jgi:hypothetical protein
VYTVIGCPVALRARSLSMTARSERRGTIFSIPTSDTSTRGVVTL